MKYTTDIKRQLLVHHTLYIYPKRFYSLLHLTFSVIYTSMKMFVIGWMSVMASLVFIYIEMVKMTDADPSCSCCGTSYCAPPYQYLPSPILSDASCTTFTTCSGVDVCTAEQTCPDTLLFDSNLRVCNWPVDVTDCAERYCDPNACPVDGGWSGWDQWTIWSSCSESCGGERTRTRTRHIHIHIMCGGFIPFLGRALLTNSTF